MALTPAAKRAVFQSQALIEHIKKNPSFIDTLQPNHVVTIIRTLVGVTSTNTSGANPNYIRSTSTSGVKSNYINTTQSYQPLVELLGSKIEKDVMFARMDLKSIAILLNALPKLGIKSEKLMGLLSDRLYKDIHKLTPPDISMSLWGLAKMGHKNDSLFKAVGNRLNTADALIKFEPRNLANTMWAFAVCEVQAPMFFKAVEKRLESKKCLDRFIPLDFVTLAWSFATLEVKNKKVFTIIESKILELVRMNASGQTPLNAQMISNLVWAFSKVSIPAPQMFSNLATQIIHPIIISQFTPQGLANVIWAYSQTDLDNNVLFGRLDAVLCQKGAGYLNEREKVTVLLAFEKCGFKSEFARRG